MKELETIRACMEQIPAAGCDYEQWLAVGMALKDAGGSAAEWDAWSRQDGRYRTGECERKWGGFRGGGGVPVGVGTIVQLCREFGGEPPSTFVDEPLDWNAVIGSHKTIASGFTRSLPEPPPISGVAQLSKYLSTLFASEECVGYVTESYKAKRDQDGKTTSVPKKGAYSQTAGELIEKLAKAKDLGSVVGDWDNEAGAWIRFNPLDGKGVADSNVTAYRYALVESDSVPVEQQNAIIQELQLPVAALVSSAGKSIHAIVRVDAPDYREYQKRVDFLYSVCKKNGLEIDRQNRNPSRLSRMPGVTRKGQVQSLLATNIGQPTWDAWADWIAAQNDDLPEVECLKTFFDDPPPLSPPLIDGVLRQGHKMLISGPSKAGKSFMLLRLAIAIAEGKDWLGFSCKQGRVLYVNLELDRSTVFHRLVSVYKASEIVPENTANIDVWNLRGRATPMTDLAPRLIRRALKRKYSAIIIDPIYKVITGDENAADQMAKFCNQFDRVCHELGAAVIYCHHHSKGAQGHKMASDRASGSGVFARDPDAMLDLIELDIEGNRRKQITQRARCAALAKLLNEQRPSWQDEVGQDDALVDEHLREYAVKTLGPEPVGHVWAAATDAGEAITAWRVEAILREFRTFAPVRCLFSYPIHILDSDGILVDAKATGETPTKEEREAVIQRRQEKIDTDMEMAFEATKSDDGFSSVKAIAEYLGIPERTARDRVKRGAERGSDIGNRNGVLVREGDPGND